MYINLDFMLEDFSKITVSEDCRLHLFICLIKKIYFISFYMFYKKTVCYMLL